uniref:Uncharacterized protein n=1 Tax=Arundo donax TaxID=35708 RepID=A0A0A9CKW6_ARUDO
MPQKFRNRGKKRRMNQLGKSAKLLIFVTVGRTGSKLGQCKVRMAC